MHKAATGKLLWIDNLRAIACVFVVILHISAPYVSKSNLPDWDIISIIHILTRASVPIFLMISGALLLPNKITLDEFFEKRFSKIFRPFAFWSAIYVILFIAYAYFFKDIFDVNYYKNLLYNSLLYGSAYHLWYMYLITAFYLLLLFFSDIDSLLNRTQLTYCLAFWLLIVGLHQLDDSNFILNLLYYLVGYLGYFLLGHFLVRHIININKYISISLLLLGLVFTFLPFKLQILGQYEQPKDWLSYRSLNVILMSMGLFLYVKNINWTYKILGLISQKSFGIYFIHLFIIMLLHKFGWINTQLPATVNVLLFSTATIVISYFSIALLEKITVLKKYLY